MEKKDKLAIALGSEMNMQIEGMEEKFKSILIGIEAPTHLMVRMRIPTKFRSQIDEGTTFLVRYVYLGNLYGFKTKSLGSVEKPYKVTFLSYPDKVESPRESAGRFLMPGRPLSCAAGCRSLARGAHQDPIVEAIRYKTRGTNPDILAGRPG